MKALELFDPRTYRHAVLICKSAIARSVIRFGYVVDEQWCELYGGRWTFKGDWDTRQVLPIQDYGDDAGREYIRISMYLNKAGVCEPDTVG